MEFSSSFQKAQIPVGCQLCEGGLKIQWKCCDCDMLMCTKCKEKVHAKFKNGNKHRIIDIKEVGQHNFGENIVFSDFNCQQHSDQTCCVFCISCKELICLKCITSTHHGHNLLEEEEYRIKREKEEQTIIEKTLKHLTIMKEEINKIKQSEYLLYDNSKKDILSQKMIIEKLVEELLNELDDKWINFSQDLEEKLNELNNMEEKLLNQNTTVTVDKLITSTDFVLLFDETNILERLTGDDVLQINIKYNSIPKFVPGEVTRDNIGTLEVMNIPEEHDTEVEFKVVRQFTSDLQDIYLATTCSDGSLWIGDSLSDVLQHIQITGNNIEELLRINTEVYDIAFSPAKELLICDDKSSLKRVSKMGEIKESNYNVAPLTPVAVHVTTSNAVIIGAITPGELFPATGRRVVIMMDQKGRRLAACELDTNNKPLFTYPARITSTYEGNICVVDRVHSDGGGRVVVLSPTGDVINTYNGQPDINNKEPFKPTGIITTTLNNIVVVDTDTHTIHILDSEGHFITYYSTKDLGIIDPYSVALSTIGNLYIGCLCPLGSQKTYKSKLYEVELSRF